MPAPVINRIRSASSIRRTISSIRDDMATSLLSEESGTPGQGLVMFKGHGLGFQRNQMAKNPVDQAARITLFCHLHMHAAPAETDTTIGPFRLLQNRQCQQAGSEGLQPQAQLPRTFDTAH